MILGFSDIDVNYKVELSSIYLISMHLHAKDLAAPSGRYINSQRVRSLRDMLKIVTYKTEYDLFFKSTNS